MKTYKNLYEEIVSLKNLISAEKKAKKGKSKKYYVQKFEENIAYELKCLHDELRTQTYRPKRLKIFILRDPKTRTISVSDFRDRVIHHALCNIIEPIFDKTFIHDSCANRKNKGTLLALNRFKKFKRKTTKNLHTKAFCLKADVKHYFKEIDRNILLKTISRKIKCNKTINLIKSILNNHSEKKGIPLGNLTSQFFANIYLNELDYFVKHKLKIKYYIRYVDDFIILDILKDKLKFWKKEIKAFLDTELKLELHQDKTKIINLSCGVDFVGFRNFYHYRLIKRRSAKNIINKIKQFNNCEIDCEKFLESFRGWTAHADMANSYNLINQKLELVSL